MHVLGSYLLAMNVRGNFKQDFWDTFVISKVMHVIFIKYRGQMVD
jgi:hypothetical protein